MSVVLDGGHHGIKNGVVRSTGMFANLPWIGECVEWIRPHLDKVALGIDLNASTGPSILGHKPDHVHNHAYGTLTTDRNTRELAREYDVLSSVGFMDRFAFDITSSPLNKASQVPKGRCSIRILAGYSIPHQLREV